jgi:hypothetical protein
MPQDKNEISMRVRWKPNIASRVQNMVDRNDLKTRQRTSIKCPISHRANKLHYLARYGWIVNSAVKDKRKTFEWFILKNPLEGRGLHPLGAPLVHPMDYHSKPRQC